MRPTIPRVAVAATAVILALGSATTATAHYVRPTHPIRTLDQRIAYLEHARAHYRYVASNGSGRPAREHARAARWADRRLSILLRPAHDPLWNCVHRHEADWDDAGWPYWGGLQMGEWFHAHYGGRFLHRIYYRKGTADHWTPLEQKRVAELAYREEGFGNLGWLNQQWPGTSWECGSYL